MSQKERPTKEAVNHSALGKRRVPAGKKRPRWEHFTQELVGHDLTKRLVPVFLTQAEQKIEMTKRKETKNEKKRLIHRILFNQGYEQKSLIRA